MGPRSGVILDALEYWDFDNGITTGRLYDNLDKRRDFHGYPMQGVGVEVRTTECERRGGFSLLLLRVIHSFVIFMGVRTVWAGRGRRGGRGSSLLYVFLNIIKMILIKLEIFLLSGGKEYFCTLVNG